MTRAQHKIKYSKMKILYLNVFKTRNPKGVAGTQPTLSQSEAQCRCHIPQPQVMCSECRAINRKRQTVYSIIVDLLKQDHSDAINEHVNRA